MRMRYSVMALAAVLVLAGAGPAWAVGTVPAGDAGSSDLFVHWVIPAFEWLLRCMMGLASVAGIALAIDAILHIRESRIAPAASTEKLRRLIENREYKELMDFAATDSSFVSRALYAAIRRAHLKYAAMREGLESSVADQTSEMFRRIEPLNVIGNIGPLLGLLGTVLGMIMAFYAEKMTNGSAGVADLAQGVATALWHTFFGLLVAIPCLLVFGLYRTKADKIATRAALVAEELLESLRPEAAEDAQEKRKTPPLPREELTKAAADRTR
jgi:biopolymer transport protein ExbB